MEFRRVLFRSRYRAAPRWVTITRPPPCTASRLWVDARRKSSVTFTCFGLSAWSGPRPAGTSATRARRVRARGSSAGFARATLCGGGSEGAVEAPFDGLAPEVQALDLRVCQERGPRPPEAVPPGLEPVGAVADGQAPRPGC